MWALYTSYFSVLVFCLVLPLLTLHLPSGVLLAFLSFYPAGKAS